MLNEINWEAYYTRESCTKAGYKMNGKCYQCSYWPNTQSEKNKMKADGWAIPDESHKVKFSYADDKEKQEWMDLLASHQPNPGLMGLGDLLELKIVTKKF